MNLESVVDRPVAVDLSADANEFVAVTLRSTGLDIAGPQDFVWGTLLRGNVAPSNGQTIPTTFKPAATFVLRGGAVVTFIQLGNNAAAIAMGDLLIQDPVNPGVFLSAPATTVTGVASTGVFTTGSAHGLVVGDPIRLISSTGATAGLTNGATYYVASVPSTTTFTVATTPNGAGITWTTNVSAGSYVAFAEPGQLKIFAWDSCPSGQTGGKIRAVLFG
jgi:hypothetical protein